MRLKYKKMLLLLTMGVFGVGMVTFSFQAKKDTDLPATNMEAALEDSSITGVLNMAGSSDAANTSATSTPTPTVTPTPTPVPEDPNKLKKNEFPEINELMETFLQAKLVTDMDVIKTCVTDVSVIDLERLQRKVEYITNYENLQCYTKPGIGEIDYVLYLVSDYRIVEINTPAPSFDVYYITYRDDKPYIYFGTISEETNQYLEELNKSEDVLELWSEVELSLENARAKDEDLNEFYLNLISQLLPTPTVTATPEQDDAN